VPVWLVVAGLDPAAAERGGAPVLSWAQGWVTG